MLIVLLILCVLFIIYSTTKLSLHPFLALLLAALFYGLASGISIPDLLLSVNEGFGNTMGSIGLVIVLGVLIGTFLEQTGGAFKLAEKVLKLIGEKRVPLGMSLIGYIVSIPVFADSGFIILQPLNKALTKKAGLSLACTSVALALGLMATHTMVPPTPGPIATAEIIGADLGIVIFWGVFVSLLCLIPILLFATKIASRTFIEANPEITPEEFSARLKNAPSATMSSLPILVPLILIVLKSFNEYFDWISEGSLFNTLQFIGTPFIALLIGFGFALLLPKKLGKEMLSNSGWVGKALKDAAVIIMITGAGGVFGKVLQNSGMADVLGEALEGINLGIWLPFIIAAALKTAQGSSTVAMITTASIIAPMLPDLGLDTDISKAFCVLAIGAGSAVVSHANDSFFWVVTQLSGMSVSQGYRLHSLGSGIMGVSAILIIAILSMFF